MLHSSSSLVADFTQSHVSGLSPLLSWREDPGPHFQLDHMVSLCSLPSFSLESAFFFFFFFYGGNDCFGGLPISPPALVSLPGVSVLFNDKSRPRSGLPGEGGGWVWQLEPLSLHGAAAAPPPLGTQMGFIQQTKPPPHPGHTGTWTQASPWEGLVTGAGRDGSKQVLLTHFSSLFSTS